MEQFLAEVRDYAAQIGVKPSTVVQNAGAGGGATWKRWEDGLSSPTLRTLEKVRKHMADNPPSAGGCAQSEAAA